MCCLVALHSGGPTAFADPDYYQALERAQAAVAEGRFAAAAGALESAQRKYPNDYALTLKLAWVHFQSAHYTDAERSYRTAAELSDGALDARVGLGWALIQQDRCEEASRVMRGVLAEEPDANADRGLSVCADRARMHGTIWGVLGGSVYQAHPWLEGSEGAFLAFRLQPTAALTLGGAYRFSHLTAVERQIPGFTQHEAYLEAGYVGEHVDFVAHGALVWGGQELVGGSRHVATTLRLKGLADYVSEALVEATGSFYRDLWVIGLAPSLTLAWWPVSVSLGVSAEQLERETLLSESLTLGLALGQVSLWVTGRYGPEYRAAHLSQLIVFNAAERSPWALLSGVRLRTSEELSLFVSYAFLRLQSGDGWLSAVHNLSFGAVITL